MKRRVFLHLTATSAALAVCRPAPAWAGLLGDSAPELSFEEFYASRYAGFKRALDACGRAACALLGLASLAPGGQALGLAAWIGRASGLAGNAAVDWGLTLVSGAITVAGQSTTQSPEADGAHLLGSLLATPRAPLFPEAALTLVRDFDAPARDRLVETCPLPPLPGPGDGPGAVADALEDVAKTYDPAKPRNYPANAALIDAALEKLAAEARKASKADRLRLGTIQGLLYLYRREFAAAAETSRAVLVEALQLAKTPLQGAFAPQSVNWTKLPVRLSLPLGVWTLGAATDPAAAPDQLVAGGSAVAAIEPESPVAPLILAGVLDGLALRQRLAPAPYAAALEGWEAATAGSKSRQTYATGQQVMLARFLLHAKKRQEAARQIVAAGPPESDRQTANAARWTVEQAEFLALAGRSLDAIVRDDAFSAKAENRTVMLQVAAARERLLAEGESLAAEVEKWRKQGG